MVLHCKTQIKKIKMNKIKSIIAATMILVASSVSGANGVRTYTVYTVYITINNVVTPIWSGSDEKYAYELYNMLFAAGERGIMLIGKQSATPLDEF